MYIAIGKLTSGQFLLYGRVLMIVRLIALLTVAFLVSPALAQGPLRLTITEGVVEPLPFAVPDFSVEAGDVDELAIQIARVVAADLTGTGLLREVPREARISKLGVLVIQFHMLIGVRSMCRLLLLAQLVWMVTV